MYQRWCNWPDHNWRGEYLWLPHVLQEGVRCYTSNYSFCWTYCIDCSLACSLSSYFIPLLKFEVVACASLHQFSASYCCTISVRCIKYLPWVLGKSVICWMHCWGVWGCLWHGQRGQGKAGKVSSNQEELRNLRAGPFTEVGRVGALPLSVLMLKVNKLHSHYLHAFSPLYFHHFVTAQSLSWIRGINRITLLAYRTKLIVFVRLDVAAGHGPPIFNWLLPLSSIKYNPLF